MSHLARYALRVAAHAAVVVACTDGHGPPHVVPALTPDEFNDAALLTNSPVFWTADADRDGTPDAEELRYLLFYARFEDTPGNPGAAAREVLASIEGGATTLPAVEDTRRRLAREELLHSSLAVVETDARAWSAADRTFLVHMLRAAQSVDDLYLQQVGGAAVRGLLDGEDLASASLFRRNWGPWCVATEDARCSATTRTVARISDAYPRWLQRDHGFCETLFGAEGLASASDPFVVLRDEGVGVRAVPYHEAYGSQIHAIATELRAAAAALDTDQDRPLAAYLGAAARALETSRWSEARRMLWALDAARWHVEITAEVDAADPCRARAAFGMLLGRPDPRAPLAAERELRPLLVAAPTAFASLIAQDGATGAVRAPLRAPSAVRAVFNAGQERHPFDAAEGRTHGDTSFVLTNLRGSREARVVEARLAQAWFTATSPTSSEMPAWYAPGTFHELAHQLVGVTLGAEGFDEWRAQAGELYLVGLALERGVLGRAAAERAYLAILLRRLTAVVRLRRPGAAVQLGMLEELGAIGWNPSASSGDGEFVGALEIRYDALPSACAELLRRVEQMCVHGSLEEFNELFGRFRDALPLHPRELAEREHARRATTFAYSILW